MNEEKPCAEPATRQEPPPANSTPDLIAALVALTQAQQAQTKTLAQLADSLQTLTENLVTLLDQIEAQDNDEATERYDTLS